MKFHTIRCKVGHTFLQSKDLCAAPFTFLCIKTSPTATIMINQETVFLQYSDYTEAIIAAVHNNNCCYKTSYFLINDCCVTEQFVSCCDDCCYETGHFLIDGGNCYCRFFLEVRVPKYNLYFMYSKQSFNSNNYCGPSTCKCNL